MNHVERFHALMAFRPVDRLPVIEWAGWWNQTVDRWHAEGLPAEMTDAAEIRAHLGLDCYRQLWIRPRADTCPGAPSHGAGIIQDAAGYDAIRPHLYPQPSFDPDALRPWAEPHARGDMVVWLTLEGFFWYPRTLFGIERHMYAFYDQPRLMHRMNEDLAEFNIRALDEFCRIVTPDFMTFAEDMSYNHGPMLSRDAFEEFIAPYYRRVVSAVKARGIVPLVDSDGDVTALIPWLKQVSIEGILPLERMAGVDVARIRRDHPRWNMIGAFDKTVMKHGEDAMRREFERLLPVMRQGGFIPAVDHQTPPDVSLEQYRGYVRLLREYAERAGKNPVGHLHPVGRALQSPTSRRLETPSHKLRKGDHPMTPRERLLAAMRGRVPDRVPLDLPGFHHASRSDLSKLSDRREIAERVFGHTHFDVAVGAHINRFLITPPQRIRGEAKVEPNGHRITHGIIDTPRGELTFVHDYDPVARTTWTAKYPVETREDIERITSIPWELPKGLKPPDTGSLPDGFAERGILRTTISSPFVCVAGMMPYETFLEMCATDLDLIKELTEVCRQRTLDCLRVLFSKPGIEYVWMGGSEWVTPPMGSPALYDALVQEQERSIIDYVHSHSNAIVHIHCHGRVRHALARAVERGADYTEPVEPPPDGDITMAEAKRLGAGRITLGGNVECRILCNETEDAVEKAVRAAFEGGKERFILRPTEGPSPTLSERESRNYMRMIDVWEELSPIDAHAR